MTLLLEAELQYVEHGRPSSVEPPKGVSSTGQGINALPQTTLFEYPVHPTTLAHSVAWTMGWIRGQHPVSVTEADASWKGNTLYVVTLNPEIIMAADKNPELAVQIRSADVVLPDGAGVVWALKRQGFKQQQRVPGIEFSEALLAQCAQEGYGVACIGASPEVMDQLPQCMAEKFPGISLTYTHHGFFQDKAHQESVAQACAQSNPRVVLVALGFPRQDQWIAAHASKFNHAVLVGVGGSFDVWSGTVQRAPALFRRLHLEWFYRLSTQPWRIKRAGKQLLLFVVKVLTSGQ